MKHTEAYLGLGICEPGITDLLQYQGRGDSHASVSISVIKQSGVEKGAHRDADVTAAPAAEGILCNPAAGFKNAR
jgi:hypothetical protein